ncbi:efflux RND transporter periplasmic adaptor subunit [Sphingomonas sp. BIUV-7]|uniref:Efflux RND transporter periplasmic adaptor subunit n=1 Tax=Sphingomonas natans TaxID=3063330 RepID=A0ABT8Y8Z0_9SPHN|nr:efflux RND transporter periplasmic adaptor subunit [Sphingomonas sp. BIUV-7]MDO6414790.1 efflux RND transporter periplasmic adaptor subunit [Sphingomonas sp. BIUV-7]
MAVTRRFALLRRIRLAARPALGLGLLALVGACGKGASAPKKQAPLVTATTPSAHTFIDRVEAVGTARANEQVTLAAPVTERIDRLFFNDGGYVRKGQIIAILAQGQEQASLHAAQADEAQALSQLHRIQALSTQGFATGTTLDQQVAAARRARSDADNARAQIADRVLRAPFSGYVSLRTISEGAVIAVGTPVATISDISRIKLDFTLPETALSSVHAGQPLLAMAAAYPDQQVRGTIETIDPVIDPSTRAATVRAILPNPGNRLKPGMLLTVGIQAATRQALAVPELAIVGDGSDRFVYVVGADMKAKRTNVTTGLHDGGLVEIRGLPANSRIITEGVVKVADGQTVRISGAADKSNAGGG